MGRKSTRAMPRERIDYTQLLAELQAGNATVDTPAAAPMSRENQAPSRFRQRLMSDEHVLYFYPGSGGEVHDKTCLRAREIPDQDLRWSKTYPNHLPQCGLCWMNAYLRLGAQDLFRRSDYEIVFEKMGMTPQLVRRMYVHEGMRTEIIGSDRLKIRCREDTWLMETMPGTRYLRLFHNNYRANSDGSRTFTPGYHEQTVCVSAKYAVKVIAGYTYAGHKAALAQRQEIPAAEPKTDKVCETVGRRTLTIWERIKCWLKALLGM